MALRTPRRRISPRAKRRYKAIREFFKRALGSSSQQDININSSIAVNVTDLKHKIVGIESQLNEVNRHCRDLTCLENDLRQESGNLLLHDRKQRRRTDATQDTETSSDRKTKSSETKLLYKNTDTRYRKSDESDYAYNAQFNNETDSFHKAPHPNTDFPSYNEHHVKIKNKSKLDKVSVHDFDRNLRKHRAQSAYENFTPGYSNSSFHSLANARANGIDAGQAARRRENKHSRHREHIEPLLEHGRHGIHKEETKRKSESPTRYEEKHSRRRKNKDRIPKVDQEFITDIINRQYKPVKLFGRRQSDLSQFSAPVCRDQEFSIREDIQEGSELCSCCYEGHIGPRYVRNHDLSDMRSICDTRLYSSKRHGRNKHFRRHVDIYNDSDLYDIIPVKEKSSPKSRRKFVEDHVIPNNYYKEIPPSPRTQRPRLNLKAQYYTEYDDYMVHVKHPNRRYLPMKQKKHREYVENMDSVDSETVQYKIRKEKLKQQKVAPIYNTPQIQQNMGTMSSLQYPVYFNEQTNAHVNEITLNKTQDTDSSLDKTDKALCEIKDILQNFLHEIKKESTPSQCDKSELTPKTTEKQVNVGQESTKTNTGILPNSGHSSFNNYNNGGQCPNAPYMPFANQMQCCYPIMPICPMNCMQSGYVVPTPSFTCQPCATSRKDTVCQECSKNKNDVANETFNSTPKNNETDALIKEIYKFVAQSPNSLRKKCQNTPQESYRRKEATPVKEKVLTSRSVGGSSRASRRDANVGTPDTKCYSKSCEAIGSRINSDTYYTNGTQSDTILEKLSLEVTQSDSELSSDSTAMEKTKRSKFKKVLQSLGLFKKKKKDVIEELSESESSMEVDIKRKRSPNPPYRQNITNYVMHGQEYYHRPPVPPYQPRAEGPYGYAPHGHDPRVSYPSAPPIQELYTPHRVHQETIHEHAAAAHYRPPYSHHHPCEPHCRHTPPQVPLCLKEIEVQSTGTQSEKKMSFFGKLAKGPPPRPLARRDPLINNSTQTAQDKSKKTGLFAGFKHLQEKIEADPMKFQYKTQKKLAEGDMKMRNAFLKKMFYKRNPFSPRNLIMKTIMGNDPSSFGEPNMKLRPRLFM